jgi:hypothetical protein
MEAIPLIIGLVFVIIVVTVFVRITMGVAEWANNNNQPILSVPACVVARRTETTGERFEFGLSGKRYGPLAEGDEGTLTYQGTRYHELERS